MPSKKKILIIGAGLGGLATALRLANSQTEVTILEKNSQPGGRLNEITLGDFKFDVGPSFLSMSYELEELFQSCGLINPLSLEPLDPVYQVFFSRHEHPFKIWKDPLRTQRELAGLEPDIAQKIEGYLQRAKSFFNDTEKLVIKSNFNGWPDYLSRIWRVPKRHLPLLLRSMWGEAARTFSSHELRVIFSLVAFFLGSTPFRTPALYSLLNYIELRHDGYWIVRGGMYRLVEELVKILAARGVRFVYDTEVANVIHNHRRVTAVSDQLGRKWEADVFVCNSDAAAFRGLILKRKRYHPHRLDRMEWGFSPFTIYLGITGKADNLLHHNYFLGDNFQDYAKTILTSDRSPRQPYYYVNVPSKWCADFAPPGCESLFILCPAPDLRYKKDWMDREQLADNIIQDLSRRIGCDLSKRILVRKVLTPVDWEKMFSLYRGSGLGLSHRLDQVGMLRPANKDEQLNNLYYVGASTVPGTGLPMVIIGSKLVQERILNDHGPLS